MHRCISTGVKIFSGWPSVPFATRPQSELNAAVLAASCGYFIPTFASCSIYFVLLCKKRRKFKNKIQVVEADLTGRNEEHAAANAEIDSNTY